MVAAAREPHDEESHVGRMDSQLAARLLRYALPYKGWITLTVLLVLLVPILDLAGTIIVKQAIDGPLKDAIELRGSTDGDGADGGDGASAEVSATALDQLLRWAGLYFVVMLVFIVLRYAQGLLMARIGQRVMRDVRTEIFRHLQRMPLSFYDRNPVGRLVTRLTNDVEALNQLFTSGVVTLLADILLLTGIAVLLVYFSLDLALVTIAVVPFLLVVTFVFRYFARKFYRQQRSQLSRLNAFTHESIQGIDVIHLFTREGDTARRYGALNEGYLRTFLKTVFAYSVYFPVLEVITASGLVAILWRGGYLIGTGGIELGVFYLFWRFLERFTVPIRDMAERYNVLQSAMAAAERIFDIIDSPETIRSRPDASVPTSLAGEIAFEDLSFAYHDDDYVLRDFDVRIAPGETVAIVGATGAGKSTIISLLNRFYDPQKGRVSVDGKDIRDYDLHAYRGRLATVLQDPFIFSRSALENIRLGNPAIDAAAAREAARRVEADRFLQLLPDGYSTTLQERGVTLSMGERQLLSFALALAHDPDILVLDEATAHIDTETEKRIERALAQLLKGRTSIIIAHRLSTIQRADRILVLHMGVLREQGTHRELLAEKGIYYRLHQLQFLAAE